MIAFDANPLSVTPAKAGVPLVVSDRSGMPAFAGMTMKWPQV
jgi:hypothetical protein